MTNQLQLQGEITSFDEDKREVDVRVIPYGVDAETLRGLERFEKGYFSGVDPSRFVFRQRHQDPPTGVGISLSEDDQWAYMRFRISRTAAGDEQLTLIKDGVERGISLGFEDGEHEIQRLDNGRRRIIHKKANAAGQLEVSTTWRPVFKEASVLQLRSEPEMAENGQEPQSLEAPPAPQPDFSQMITALSEKMDAEQKLREQMYERLVALSAGVPQEGQQLAQHMVRQVRLQVRALEDVITTGNEGVIPEMRTREMLGEVDTGRPFLNNTRRLTDPGAGTSLVIPKITQRPIVGEQESEKAELASQATIITTVDFPMRTVGGAGDLSMQLIKRSSPEFLDLWLRLLGQAYATDTEDKGLDALLAAGTTDGGALDVEAPTFGEAFTNSATATGRTMIPDRIFLSTEAVAKFMDAVEPAGGGGRPLYPGIASISGLGAEGQNLGPGTNINLRPVWVPALDDETPDIIVGPSQAFGWAEDGTYTLQADVPSKFGRDVGLAGMIWYAPLYPAAFTRYTLAA